MADLTVGGGPDVGGEAQTFTVTTFAQTVLDDATAGDARTTLDVDSSAEVDSKVASGAYVHPNHSGDVTSAGDGAQTIAANAVTNAKAAQMATKTYKGRTSAGTGNSEDVAVATLKTDLSLGNVDNTSDATKNAASATLDNKTIDGGTY